MTRSHPFYLTVFFCLLGACQAASAESQLRRAAQDEDTRAIQQPDVQEIRGGNPVVDPLPWYAFFNGTRECSAVLVHADIAITTASCVRNANNEIDPPKAIRVGSLNRTSGGTVVNVTQAIVHPDYKAVTGPGNIAVLKLKSALTNTVALMNEDPLVPLSGTDVVFMTGLGKTDNARFPTSLQGLYTFYLEDCYSTVPFYDPIYHVCTQANPSSFGGCEGDAGSPLVMPSSRTLVALHGFADDVCEKQTVNGNTRISTYAGWVKEQICDISATKPSYCTSTKDGCLLTNILDEVSNTFTGAFSKLSSVFRGGA